MSSLTDFLDSYPSKAKTAPQPAPTKPAIKKPIVVTKPIPAEEIAEYDYLGSNGWKVYRNSWVDPITKNLCEEPIAWAIQQERDRVAREGYVAPVTESYGYSQPIQSQMQRKPNAPMKQNKAALFNTASELLESTTFDGSANPHAGNGYSNYSPQPNYGNGTVTGMPLVQNPFSNLSLNEANQMATQSDDAALMASLGIDPNDMAFDPNSFDPNEFQ